MKSFFNTHAVIGLGFGDEGKGVSVNSLCQSLENPLVVRFSGGQQAGHTVTLGNGISHVFSNFGSGSLNGFPTYWSKYCTFDPVGTINELNVLINKGFRPKLFLDKKSPITTPYDIFHNRRSDAKKHGTCGVGVGTTFEREKNHYSLLVGDLLNLTVFKMKLNLIKEYYDYNDVDLFNFLDCCKKVLMTNNITFVDNVPTYSNYIFEGSQGLLLDQNFGLFPHVTRANTGSKNILEMGALKGGIDKFALNIYLVTRAFQTRHGNGPMTNTDIPHNIKDNPKETNVLNKYQGEFRKSLLDLDLLKYGIERDDYIRTTRNKELIITCLDLIKGEYRYTINGEIIGHLNEEDFVEGIVRYLGIDKVHCVRSPLSDFVLTQKEEEINTLVRLKVQ